MAHFYWFSKQLFLLLMIFVALASVADTRPARPSGQSDLIAGNEFLKLIFERDEMQRDLHSDEYQGHGDSGSSTASRNLKPRQAIASQGRTDDVNSNNANKNNYAINGRATNSANVPIKARNSARSLDYKTKIGQNNLVAQKRVATGNTNDNIDYNDGADDGDSKVVKLVTSGSKIVFLEEYDDIEDDAIVDAVAREIDLKKEKVKTTTTTKAPTTPKPHSFGGQQQKRQQQQHNNFNGQSNKANRTSDDFKVLAVSVSSSSKRVSPPKQYLQTTTQKPLTSTTTTRNKSFNNKFVNNENHHPLHETNDFDEQTFYEPTKSRTTTTTPRTKTTKAPTTRATTATARRSSTLTTAASSTTTTTAATTNAAKHSTLIRDTNDNFINRSHKSELSIEEIEPLTMSKQKQQLNQQQQQRQQQHRNLVNLADNVADSENSASTNVHKILAAPGITTRSTHNDNNNNNNNNLNHNNRNALTRQMARINQTMAASLTSSTSSTSPSTSQLKGEGVAGDQEEFAALLDDKLLPFQTVIYHDTQEGHGPQSRSISYSSLSQNVDELDVWQQSGILAEAQRNVSESLKPMPRAHQPTAEHQSHPHSSEPAKMYGVPSKFYSEPAKVYSEPAKVYGQPSKFYSEAAKVYSQPSKVYGEPAKTYWPQPSSVTTTTTSTSTTTITATPAAKSLLTTFTPQAAGKMQSSSRRPAAIVSRIAFGEAQTMPTSSETANANQITQSTSAPSKQSQQQQQQYQYQYRNYQKTQKPSAQEQQQQAQAHRTSSTYGSFHHQQQHDQTQENHQRTINSQARRVLFNLDKLPYDLLNAPVQSEQHLLEPDFVKSQTPNPCSSIEPQQQQSLYIHNHQSQQQQQHPLHSSFSDKHNNQNAKGLPNRDLVKCVSKFSIQSTAADATLASPNAAQQSHYTTERNNHNNQQHQLHHHQHQHQHHRNNEELYRPTPERNYEIEETVSVMTNGRAHSLLQQQQQQQVDDFGGPPTTSKPATTTRSHFYIGNRLKGTTTGEGKPDEGRGGTGGRGNFRNSNLNANVGEKNYRQHHDNDDDDHYNGEGNIDYNDDNTAAIANGEEQDEDNANNNNNNDGEDDSKVAYVVEGRNYHKYRVEEKTDDGFIVGEFGVVDHNDGNIRGVRYSADSTINPSLIQKALLTFLKLK